MSHIFISYSRQDSEIMQRVRDYLRGEGLDVWTDEKLTPGTRSWKQEIERALEHAACLVVILSPNAKNSDWVREEMNYAEAHDVRIFPVLADGSERRSIPFGFITAQRVDIRREESFASEMQKLVFTIRVHYVDLVESLTWGDAPAPVPLPPAPVEDDEDEPAEIRPDLDVVRFPSSLAKAIMVLQNRESKWWRRVDAINRLAELHNPLALPVLEAYLEDRDMDVQRAAQQAIERIQNPERKKTDTLPEMNESDRAQLQGGQSVDSVTNIPAQEALKLVITGPLHHLRTQFIRAISDIEVISTAREIKPRYNQSSTSISMDYGCIHVEDIVLYLFGTPVQRRFDFMWQILAEGMLGYVLIIDVLQPETFEEARSIRESFESYARVPYVVAVEHMQPQDEAFLRHLLQLGEEVRVLPCASTDSASVKTVLLELSYQILEQASN